MFSLWQRLDVYLVHHVPEPIIMQVVIKQYFNWDRQESGSCHCSLTQQEVESVVFFSYCEPLTN